MTNATLAMLLLASSSVMAEADYPAANFQPKILFQDESVIANKAADPAPGTPCVAQAGTQPAAVVSSNDRKAEFDPAYPAANFQPKVIFSDAN
ncbi:MAG: hypothetical protein KGZ80_11835 [Methylomonas sp.]|nr:hypothetical protein [Methylomonas sp.]PPD19610.1 MAG: hypothetical protein CTY23_11425 [Methylomonas sp.]PPD25698.1 MAG: hypothetical protein CTY22_07580 [Methylomonas sp.]PPD36909.1 MAG: hypothetical protein CTY21_07580 [Methylomonas sp.]PPD38713.1 MAG: hypothetical protein CTY17_09100 [Methylomonas sp.]